MDERHLRSMETSDLASVTGIHQQAFSDFFLTSLGEAFLRELYAGILADPSGICFVYEQGRQLHGFVAGTDAAAGLYARLLRSRWWRFALASIQPCLARPAIVRQLVRALRMPSRARRLDGHGLLMSLAVLPQHQGNGVGGVLVRAFLKEARRRGLTSVSLTTDAVQNDRANGFYRRVGFQVIQLITTPEGRRLHEYAIDLRQTAEEPRAGLEPAAAS